MTDRQSVSRFGSCFLVPTVTVWYIRTFGKFPRAEPPSAQTTRAAYVLHCTALQAKIHPPIGVAVRSYIYARTDIIVYSENGTRLVRSTSLL